MFGRLVAILGTFAVIVFAGWLMLRRGDIPYDQLAAIYADADSRYLTLGDDMRVHFRDVGPRDAPVIVLVHGFSASLHTWEAWVDDLKRDYRVVSLDLPGHGLSRCIDNDFIGPAQFVDVIERLATALKIKRFTIAGSSMGGGAAWNYALAHPERVEGLVLVAASGWRAQTKDDGETPFAFRVLQFGPARQVIKDLDLTMLARSGLEDSFYDPTFVTDEMVDRYAALARAPCHREALLNLMAGQSGRNEARPDLMAQISAPTLVMHGDADRIVPPSGSRRFAETIPGAELRLYENVGHLPQEEIAARSLADFRAFLATRVHGAAAPIAAPGLTHANPG